MKFRSPKTHAEVDYKDKKADEYESLGFISLASPKVITKVQKCLPTGIPALDVISARDMDGVWGMPFGRQIEFSGPPDSGKTTNLINIAAAAQRNGHEVFWIEAEHSLNGQRAKTLNVDIEKLRIKFPDSLEDGLQGIKDLVEPLPKRNEKGYDRNHGRVICFDSIAAISTKNEMEDTIEKAHVAEAARKLFQFMRMLNSKIAKRNVMVVYSNQIISKIGIMFGRKTQTYGGNAVRYHASLRFECAYIGKLKEGTNVVGIRQNIENLKNKCYTPFLKIEDLEFNFSKGYNYYKSLVIALDRLGYVKKSGVNYIIWSLGKDKKMRMADFTKLLIQDKVLCTKFERLIYGDGYKTTE